MGSAPEPDGASAKPAETAGTTPPATSSMPAPPEKTPSLLSPHQQLAQNPLIPGLPALGASSAHAPGAPLPDPLTQPRAVLEAVVDMIAATDKEGYFLFPVDERQAPNYYTIIKQPMCFGDIKRKLSEDAYPSWRTLMSDMELIVSNARTFNTSKTKCYKCAQSLQRNITRLMSQHELVVRKAFSVLHPSLHTGSLPNPLTVRPLGSLGRGAPSTSDMTSQATSLVQGATPAVHAGTTPGGTAGGDGGPDGATATQTPLPAPEPSTAGMAAGAGTGLAGSLTAATSMRLPASPPLPVLTLPLAPIRLDPLCSAYSDNEDMEAAVQHHNQGVHGVDAASQGGEHSGGAEGGAHAPPLMPLEALLAQLRQAAQYQAWLLGGAQGAHREEGGPAPGRGGEASGAVPEPAHGPSWTGHQPRLSRPRAWRQATRPLEWQCHWLELRLAELQHHIARLSPAQPDAPGPARSSAAASTGRVSGPGNNGGSCPAGLQPPSHDAGSGGSSSTVAADLQHRQQRLEASVARWVGTQPLRPLPHAPPPLPGKPGVVEAASREPVQAPLVSGLFLGGGSAPARPVDTAVPPTVAAPQQQADVEMSDAQTDPIISGPTAPAPPSTNATSSASPDRAVTSTTATPPSLPPPPARISDPPAGTGTGAVGPSPQAPSSLWPGLPDPLLPAAVFSSLEALELQLTDVKRGLSAAFGWERGGAVTRGAHRAAVAATGPGAASRAGGIPGAPPVNPAPLYPPGSTVAGALLRKPSSARSDSRRQASVAGGGGPGSKTAPHATDSKRKRAGGEVQAGPGGATEGAAGDGLVPSRSYPERPQVAIYIPPVRELPADEWAARLAATTTWGEAYAKQGPAALSRPPPAVAAVLSKCDEGEGSSSEDTSDEAYVALHAVMAEEERKRFAAWAAEGQRRRNKGPSQAQQQAGAAGSAGGHTKPGRRASKGVKTVRAASGMPPQPPQPPAPPGAGDPAQGGPDGGGAGAGGVQLGGSASPSLGALPSGAVGLLASPGSGGGAAGARHVSTTAVPLVPVQSTGGAKPPVALASPVPMVPVVPAASPARTAAAVTVSPSSDKRPPAAVTVPLGVHLPGPLPVAAHTSAAAPAPPASSRGHVTLLPPHSNSGGAAGGQQVVTTIPSAPAARPPKRAAALIAAANMGREEDEPTTSSSGRSSSLSDSSDDDAPGLTASGQLPPSPHPAAGRSGGPGRGASMSVSQGMHTLGGEGEVLSGHEENGGSRDDDGEDGSEPSSPAAESDSEPSDSSPDEGAGSDSGSAGEPPLKQARRGPGKGRGRGGSGGGVSAAAHNGKRRSGSNGVGGPAPGSGGPLHDKGPSAPSGSGAGHVPVLRSVPSGGAAAPRGELTFIKTAATTGGKPTRGSSAGGNGSLSGVRKSGGGVGGRAGHAGRGRR